MNQNPNELLGNDTESEKPEGVDEAKWKEAKEKATSEYGYSQDNPRYWKIVQGIYEKIENASKLSRLSEKGRIKWWDRRDKEGIIVDAKGNEYYFNASTLKYGNPDDGKSVEFQPTEHGGTSTASNVKVI